MKTLIIYDNKGRIISTQAINEYDYLVADIPEDKQAVEVKDGQVILDDSEEVKAKKKIIQEQLNKEKNKFSIMKEAVLSSEHKILKLASQLL